MVASNFYVLLIFFTSPETTQTNDGTRQIDHNTGPTPATLFEQCHGFFRVPFQLMSKDERHETNGFTSPPNDVIV